MSENKGHDNLIPASMRSKEEVRRNARKGGINSGKTRRRKADMKKLLELGLRQMVIDKNGFPTEMSYAERITLTLLTIAANPKQGGAAVKAYEKILHTIGQDEPEQKQEDIEILKQILLENRKNAESLHAEPETE